MLCLTFVFATRRRGRSSERNHAERTPGDEFREWSRDTPSREARLVNDVALALHLGDVFVGQDRILFGFRSRIDARSRVEVVSVVTFRARRWGASPSRRRRDGRGRERRLGSYGVPSLRRRVLGR